MEYALSLGLVLLSALFSGLTIGIFSLDSFTIKRQAELGDTDAVRVYPIRAKGNLVLTTFLLGNVVVNSTLAIFLANMTTGIIAGFLATALIFLFGEVIPQAVFARHGLRFASLTSPLIHLFIFIGYPITKPIAFLLDKALGHEVQRMYSKKELMQIVSEHEESEHSAIDEDEERIIHGALTFSHRTVAEVMTPLEKVIAFEENNVLDEAFRTTLAEHNYARYPVYRDTTSNIIGTLYARDILAEDGDVAIVDAKEAFEQKVYHTRASEHLDTLLGRMLKTRHHQYVVYNELEVPVGVISLEDIIEEIIQQEIEDEDDVR